MTAPKLDFIMGAPTLFGVRYLHVLLDGEETGALTASVQETDPWAEGTMWRALHGLKRRLRNENVPMEDLLPQSFGKWKELFEKILTERQGKTEE